MILKKSQSKKFKTQMFSNMISTWIIHVDKYWIISKIFETNIFCILMIEMQMQSKLNRINDRIKESYELTIMGISEIWHDLDHSIIVESILIK